MTQILRYSNHSNSTHSNSIASNSAAPDTYLGITTKDGSGVIELTKRLGSITDLTTLLSGPGIAAAREHENEAPDHQLADITYERVVGAPSKTFCIGVNYGGRANEYSDVTDAAYPSVFPRFPDSFTAHEQPLIRPPESEQLDYEGEIVVVIGKGGRRIPVAEARNHIAGLTLGNEGTIRDWVRHAKFNVTQGKNWRSSGAMGPWMVPVDEFDDLENLEITTTVNGDVRQQDSTASMKYSIAYQVHYLSTFTDLAPGDVIFSGTPTGAGARHDPPVWLEPGDTIEVSVPGIGTLRNSVADEFAAGTPEANFAAPETQ